MKKLLWSDRVTFSLVYFVQGALGLSGLALPFFLREILGLSIPQVAYLFGVTSLPWVLKPLYGLLSDFYPLFGYRRKTYLILANVLACGGWIITAFAPNYQIILIAQLLASLGIAASDVFVDGLAVQKSTKKTRGLIQGICWGSRSTGSILTGFLGGYLLTILSFKTIFLLTATLPLLTVCISAVIREKKYHVKRNGKSVLKNIIRQYKHTPTIWWVALFLFIWFMGPSFSLPLLFYLKEQLLLTGPIIGGFRSVFYIGGVIGAIIFVKFFDQFSHKKNLKSLIWLNIFGSLSFLLIQNIWTGFSIYFINGIIGIATMVAAMKLIAQVCPKKLEATTFALVTGIANLASGTVSQWMGGLVFGWVGYVPLILISAAFGILPLFFLHKIQVNQKYV